MVDWSQVDPIWTGSGVEMFSPSQGMQFFDNIVFLLDTAGVLANFVTTWKYASKKKDTPLNLK